MLFPQLEPLPGSRFWLSQPESLAFHSHQLGAPKANKLMNPFFLRFVNDDRKCGFSKFNDFLLCAVYHEIMSKDVELSELSMKFLFKLLE